MSCGSMRILLVDDDQVLAQTLTHQLTAHHYTVDVAVDGEAGWRFAKSATYELMVLDVNLPKLNGIELCQRLRQHGYHQPILLLTAKADSADKVIGLDAGADDYVVKPCTVEELCARIRALLRRQSESNPPVLEWGNLCLDPSRCEVTYLAELVALSAKEYSLLELFLRHPQRVFSSSSILDHLWGFEVFPGEEAVRTLIKRLRRKLKAVGAENVIETVYGIGYRLTPLTAPIGESQSASESRSSTADRARAAALSVWEQFEPVMLKRVALIEQVVAIRPGNSVPKQLRERAEQAAHKLVGSLGMFGLVEGSRLSQEIECCLQTLGTPNKQTLLVSLVERLRREMQAFSPLSPRSDFQPFQSSQSCHLFSQPAQQETGLDRSIEPGMGLTTCPVVLLVGEDEVIQHSHRHLQVAGEACGIRVDVATVAESKIRLFQQVPDAILFDLPLAQSWQSSLGLLEELAVQVPHLPVLVFADGNDFDDRLEIARRVRCRVISKTTSPHDVLAMVRDALVGNCLAQARVLAVDDDPLTLKVLQQMLSRQGIHLVTLHDPRQCWQTLGSIAPDLLILDVDMPQINGIELCRVVRSDRTWDQLPILILTAYKDATIVQQLFSAGADDYLPKPFTELEIVSRICNRLQRQRLLRTVLQ